MKKYKMNKNREKLSDDDLREKMEFDRFLRDYKPAPFYKTLKFYIAFSLVGILIVGGWYLLKEEGDVPVKSLRQMEAQLFLHPPLTGVNIADTTYELNGSRDTVLFYASGSELHIPANAFLDKKGNVVNGPVHLRYREFHDVVDFFLSGIPMTYDSAGKQYQFESAGMLDIGAFREDEVLYANVGKPITVEMASYRKDLRFNTYYLDSVERKWENKGKDFLISSPKGAVASPLLKLKAPVKANPVQQKFDIAFDKTLFPELVVYDGVSFQVSANEKSYDPKLAMKEWDNVKIERNPDGVHYLVTFSDPGEVHSFLVEPVFAGTDYLRAKKLYEEKIKKYESMASSGKSTTDGKKRKMDSIYQSQYATVISVNEQARRGPRLKSEKQVTGDLVFRQFTLSRFGVWNSDCPQSLPQGKMIFACFTDLKKGKFDFDHVYLAERGRRAMFSYYPDRYEKISYNPEASNLIWAVTKDNKLAIFATEEFEKLKKDTDTSYFKMNIIEKRVSSPAEVRKLLGM
jgi:hypothetical protein